MAWHTQGTEFVRISSIAPGEDAPPPPPRPKPPCRSSTAAGLPFFSSLATAVIWCYPHSRSRTVETTVPSRRRWRPGPWRGSGGVQLMRCSTCTRGPTGMGRVRPLSQVEGRRRAARLMAGNPRASLPEVTVIRLW